MIGREELFVSVLEHRTDQIGESANSEQLPKLFLSNCWIDVIYVRPNKERLERGAERAGTSGISPLRHETKT